MRAVVDTNVLIRTIIKPLGTVGAVLQRLAAGDYHIVYSRPLLDELVEKLDLPRLKDKYGITVEMVAGLLAVLSLRGSWSCRKSRCPSVETRRTIWLSRLRWPATQPWW